MSMRSTNIRLDEKNVFFSKLATSDAQQSLLVYSNFDNLIERAIKNFGSRETEHNWESVESDLKELTKSIVNPSSLNLGSFKRLTLHVVCHSILSERTRLSSAAMDLVRSISQNFGNFADISSREGSQEKSVAVYECLIDATMSPLMKICERTNRVFVVRAQSTLQSLLEAGKLAPSIIRDFAVPKLVDAMNSSNKGLRLAVLVPCLSVIIENDKMWNVEGSLQNVETIIKSGLQDAALEVRQAARQCFLSFDSKNPCRAAKIMEGMPSTVLKSLGYSGADKKTNYSVQSQVLMTKARPTVEPGLEEKRLKASTPVQLNNNRSSKVMVVNSCEASPVISNNHVSLGKAPTAQRVMRDSGCKSKMQSAQRVLSNSILQNPVILSSKNYTHSSIVEDKTLVVTKPSLLNKSNKFLSSARETINSKQSTASTIKVDFIEIFAQAKDPDWSIRQSAFEQLCKLLSTQRAIDSSSNIIYSNRLWDLAIQGLDDAHFRVIQATLQYVRLILKHGKLQNNDSKENVRPSHSANSSFIAVNSSFLERISYRILNIANCSTSKTKAQEQACEIFCHDLPSFFKNQEGNVQFIDLLITLLFHPEINSSNHKAILMILEQIICTFKNVDILDLNTTKNVLARLSSVFRLGLSENTKVTSNLLIDAVKKLIYEIVSKFHSSDSKVLLEICSGLRSSQFRDFLKQAIDNQQPAKENDVGISIEAPHLAADNDPTMLYYARFDEPPLFSVEEDEYISECHQMITDQDCKSCQEKPLNNDVIENNFAIENDACVEEDIQIGSLLSVPSHTQICNPIQPYPIDNEENASFVMLPSDNDLSLERTVCQQDEFDLQFIRIDEDVTIRISNNPTPPLLTDDSSAITIDVGVETSEFLDCDFEYESISKIDIALSKSMQMVQY